MTHDAKRNVCISAEHVHHLSRLLMKPTCYDAAYIDNLIRVLGYILFEWVLVGKTDILYQ